MFTQLKNAVENLSQQSPSSSSSTNSNTRTNVAFSPLLANKPKSEASGTEQHAVKRTPSADSRSRPKLSLEDRLRASFNSGGASIASSPSISETISRAPSPANPAAIPLPLSPPPSPMELSSVAHRSADALHSVGISNPPFSGESSEDHPLSPEPDDTREPDNPAPVTNVPLTTQSHTDGGPHVQEPVALEQLQMKLKLLEKRFAGTIHTLLHILARLA
jgi:hypothetical protein